MIRPFNHKVARVVPSWLAARTPTMCPVPLISLAQLNEPEPKPVPRSIMVPLRYTMACGGSVDVTLV